MAQTDQCLAAPGLEVLATLSVSKRGEYSCSVVLAVQCPRLTELFGVGWLKVTLLTFVLSEQVACRCHWGATARRRAATARHCVATARHRAPQSRCAQGAASVLCCRRGQCWRGVAARIIRRSGRLGPGGSQCVHLSALSLSGIFLCSWLRLLVSWGQAGCGDLPCGHTYGVFLLNLCSFL